MKLEKAERQRLIEDCENNITPDELVDMYGVDELLDQYHSDLGYMDDDKLIAEWEDLTGDTFENEEGEPPFVDPHQTSLTI